MKSSSIDLNLLRIFETVFDERNVSRAAERLGLSQPAVSGALARLSKQIGEPLFQRARGGVIPTPRAQRLIGPVRDALALRSTVAQGETDKTSATARRFRIGMFGMAEPALLPHVIRTIMDESLDVVLDIVAAVIADPAAKLTAGALDLMFHLRPVDNDEIITQPLRPTPFVCVTRPGWTDSNGPLDAAALAGAFQVQIVVPEALATGEGLSDISAAGARRSRQVQSHQGVDVPNVVAVSDLVAILPLAFASVCAPRFGLEIHPLPVNIRFPVHHMSWHRRVDNDPLHAQLRGMFIDAIERFGPATPPRSAQSRVGRTLSTLPGALIRGSRWHGRRDQRDSARPARKKWNAAQSPSSWRSTMA